MTETTKKVENAPKVKVSDLILAVIANAVYLKDEDRNKLIEEINAKLAKVTAPNFKGVIANEVKTLLMAAGVKGLTKDAMFTAISKSHPEIGPMKIAENLYLTLQPANYEKGKKFGWNVTVKEGGFFVWNEVK